MSDNIQITPGSGATVAADEVGGAFYQRMKPCVGSDGEAIDVSQDNPMPVQISDVMIALVAAIERLNTPMWVDAAQSRVRISIEGQTSIGTPVTVRSDSGSQLGTVGGISANSMILDAMMNNYANTVRPRIT